MAEEITFKLEGEPEENKTIEELADIQSMTAITSKGGIRNKKVVKYLQKKAYPQLKQALLEFITIIHENGELEKHWSKVEKQNFYARKAASKLDKLQKKLEMGSDYDGES